MVLSSRRREKSEIQAKFKEIITRNFTSWWKILYKPHTILRNPAIPNQNEYNKNHTYTYHIKTARNLRQRGKKILKTATRKRIHYSQKSNNKTNKLITKDKDIKNKKKKDNEMTLCFKKKKKLTYYYSMLWESSHHTSKKNKGGLPVKTAM